MPRNATGLPTHSHGEREASPRIRVRPCAFVVDDFSVRFHLRNSGFRFARLTVATVNRRSRAVERKLPWQNAREFERGDTENAELRRAKL